MAPKHSGFSTKRAYISCLIGLAITETLLYAITKTLFMDPLAARPDIFIVVALFALILALAIRHLSARFVFVHSGNEITVWSPLPWAKKREISTAKASARVRANLIDRIIGTTSVEIYDGRKKHLFGPLEAQEAAVLAKSINGKK